MNTAGVKFHNGSSLQNEVQPHEPSTGKILFLRYIWFHIHVTIQNKNNQTKGPVSKSLVQLHIIF